MLIVNINYCYTYHEIIDLLEDFKILIQIERYFYVFILYLKIMHV